MTAGTHSRPGWRRLSIAVLAGACVVWTPARAQEPATRSASGSVARAQGLLIVALTGLLQRGAVAPISIRARMPLAGTYAGPDAALLQLQSDAIALGLETFSTAPASRPRAAPAGTR